MQGGNPRLVLFFLDTQCGLCSTLHEVHPLAASCAPTGACSQCCLLELINHEPPERSRARRWARCLAGVLEAGPASGKCGTPSSGCSHIREYFRQPSRWLASCLRAVHFSGLLAAFFRPAEGTWPEICRRYLLSTRSSKIPPDTGELEKLLQRQAGRAAYSHA